MLASSIIAGLPILASVIPARALPIPARTFKVRAVFLFLQTIRDVQKGIAFQAHVDKRRLHARKHTRYSAFVNGTSKGVFVLALVIDFCELVVLKNRKPRLMRRCRNAYFL